MIGPSSPHLLSYLITPSQPSPAQPSLLATALCHSLHSCVTFLYAAAAVLHAVASGSRRLYEEAFYVPGSKVHIRTRVSVLAK